MKSAFVSLAILFCIFLLSATTPPVVSNMTAAQRTDGSYIIDIYYDVYDADGDTLSISLQVSDDNGLTCNVPCTMVSGDIGTNINQGNNKHIVWNLGLEHPMVSSNFSFKVSADDGYEPPTVPVNFVLVPGGSFTMGDTRGGGNSNELPTHSVTLNSFYMAKYEVTQSEWQAVMGTWNSDPLGWGSAGVGSNYPVYYVSWYAILKYCNLRSMAEGLTPVYTISSSTDPANWGAVPTSNNATWNAAICNWSANGYRLPTEAEWEYAARGATNTPDYLYSGSNDINAVAWYDGNNTPNSTKPVGTKAHNGIGLYDMSGNVFEWCWDWYADTYNSSSPINNPTGPTSGTFRVRRGGSFDSSATSCRVAFRSGNNPNFRYNFIGLRVVRAIN
ncbi:MAG: SUMF1/EgtB/PvdO family nonheme iron enzyme [Candidatus Cloacimonadaceae bacterium]|nr:SUMF1/EgtB/PvdO family nonheme iron enzyme [Candidatus Cloacimonadaceae bacterium]